MRFFYLFILVFGFQTMSLGQLNLSILYSISYTQPDTHQRIIDQFTEDRPFLDRQFEDIRFLNGYGIGLRYKMDHLAFNFRYESQLNRLRTSGQDPSNNENFNQTLFFKLSTFSIGLESFFTEHWSIHGSFELNNASYRSEINNLDRIDLANDFGTGSTFSIGYNFIGGGITHVSIRPFVHFSWSNHDLTSFNEALNPGINTVSEDLEEEFLNFGVKLIFYNGQW